MASLGESERGSPPVTVEGDQEPSDEAGGLRKRALLGAVLLAFQTGGSQVIRLAANLVLTRLLVPEMFGQVALVHVLMMGVAMLTDIGIRDSVVRSPRGEDPTFLNTAWTIQVIRSTFMCALVCLLSIPYARFYEQPLLGQLIPIAAFQILLVGLESTKELALDRQIALARLVPLEIGSQVFGLACMIGMAYSMRSVWALIFGTLVGAAMRCLLTHIALPGHNNRFRMEAEARHEITTYGRWILVSSTLTFGASSLDRLIFGKLVPLDILGIFGIAKTLAEAPSQLTNAIGSRVVFPAYSEILGRGQRLADAFERARNPLLVGAGYLLAGVAACSQPLVDILYDDRYRQAGEMLALLPLGIWFQTIGTTNGGAIKALGHPRVLAVCSSVQVGLLALGLGPATMLFGVNGGIGVLVASSLGSAAVSTGWLARRDLCTWYGAFPMTLLLIVSGLAGHIAASRVDAVPIIRLLLAGLVASAFWAWPLRRLAGRLLDR